MYVTARLFCKEQNVNHKLYQIAIRRPVTGVCNSLYTCLKQIYADRSKMISRKYLDLPK